MELLPSQKKRVFDLVKGAGIDPSTMKFESTRSNYRKGEKAWEITVIWTSFYFRFDRNYNQPLVLFSPGRSTLKDSDNCLNWEHQLDSLKSWCGYLKREIDAGDPWAELERQRSPFRLDE